MSLFVLGLRRSGTTILYDALREDPDLTCYYEPLREQEPTIGGGSGARDDDAFAQTRERRDAFMADHYPDLQPELFNWGGPRAPELELEATLPPFVSEFLGSLLESAPDVAIKETRLHHKLGEVARLDPQATVVHLVRDPRAVAASMLLGRRRRTDIYPDADTFFTARTGRRLWSSRRISEAAGASLRSLELPNDLPDFLRPLIVWKVAFQTADGDGRRLFGDRYVLVRLEDLRVDPAAELAAHLRRGRAVDPAAGCRVGRGERKPRFDACTWPTIRAGHRPPPCSSSSLSSSAPAMARSPGWIPTRNLSTSRHRRRGRASSA